MVLLRMAICLSIVCAACASSRARAQAHKHSASIHWGVAIPACDSYIDKASAANLSAEWSFRLIPMLSAGVSAGYTSLCEEVVQDGYFDEAFVSGRREKRQYVMPIMAQFDFFPMGTAETLLRPYLGVGVGCQYAKFRITGDTIATSGRSNWAESFSARLGTRIYPVRGGWLFLDARCTWNYGGNKWPLAKAGPIQNFGITAGIGGMF